MVAGTAGKQVGRAEGEFGEESGKKLGMAKGVAWIEVERRREVKVGLSPVHGARVHTRKSLDMHGLLGATGRFGKAMSECGHALCRIAYSVRGDESMVQLGWWGRPGAACAGHAAHAHFFPLHCPLQHALPFWQAAPALPQVLPQVLPV